MRPSPERELERAHVYDSQERVQGGAHRGTPHGRRVRTRGLQGEAYGEPRRGRPRVRARAHGCIFIRIGYAVLNGVYPTRGQRRTRVSFSVLRTKGMLRYGVSGPIGGTCLNKRSVPCPFYKSTGRGLCITSCGLLTVCTCGSRVPARVRIASLNFALTATILHLR